MIVRLVVFLLLLAGLAWSAGPGSYQCREPLLMTAAPANPQPAPVPLRAVTLNLAREESIDAIGGVLDQPPLAGAGVIFLQETVHPAAPGEESLLSRAAERLGYHGAFASAADMGGGAVEGVAIWSRLPLRDVEVLELERFELNVNSRCRIALAATVEAPGGAIRVFSLHLDTRINAAERVRQIMPVIEAAKNFDGPALIAGDFNTNNNYWIGRLLPLPFATNQVAAVLGAMEANGFQTPQHSVGTHDLLGLRLDWIFLRGIAADAWGVEPIRFSDHRAVWVELGVAGD